MKVSTHAFFTLTALFMGSFFVFELPVEAGEYEDGVGLYKSGKIAEAANLLQSFIGKNPSDLKARYYLANAYASLGQRNKAIEQYNYCANAAPGTKMEEYCLRAMGMQNLKSNSLPSLKQPMKDLQRDTESKVDMQAKEYRANLEAQRKNEQIILAKKIDAQVETIRRQMALDVDNVPRYIYIGNKIYSNRDYQTDVKKIKLEAERRISDLTSGEDSEMQRLNECFDKRLEEFSESHDGIRTALKSAKGNMQLTPHGTDMYVRNYMNFGQEKVWEPPPSLQARPLTLLDKIPESTRADRIRQLRRRFQN
ncbi:tetratricopeptide repeat protein [bacterium]|nr:tetratricopeptide repeat protein [bacterium]QQR59298.1 MAG: tetratricopeptide repeat protein [Candidatus Melainabacteria bacterium]